MQQIDIHNGPGLGEIIHNGPLFRCFFSTTFTVTKFGSQDPIDRKEEFEKEPLLVTGSLVGILFDAVDIRNQELGKKPDESPTDPGRLSIILHHRGIRFDNHYLSFRYDLKTRKGNGWHFTEDEFFTANGCPLAKIGDEQRKVNLPLLSLLSPRNFGTKLL